jgi:hypothetical protein
MLRAESHQTCGLYEGSSRCFRATQWITEQFGKDPDRPWMMALVVNERGIGLL